MYYLEFACVVLMFRFKPRKEYCFFFQDPPATGASRLVGGSLVAEEPCMGPMKLSGVLFMCVSAS